MTLWRWKNYREGYSLHVVARDDARRLWLCPAIISGWEDRVPWWGSLDALERLEPAAEARLLAILGMGDPSP